MTLSRHHNVPDETQYPSRRNDEKGFSLVEVLIAAGITAAILISISGMFILGTQKVKGGRNLSAATTVNQSILEQMRGMRGRTIYGVLNGQTGDSVVTWSTDLANPAYSGDNEDLAAEYGLIVDDWRAVVREALPRGRVIFTVEGFANRPTGGNDGTATLGGARFLRIEVSVAWTEVRGRSRVVTTNLIKF